MKNDGLQSDVNSLDVLISLADLYVQNGLIDEAKGLLETAIQQNKDSIKPYCKLGEIYIKENNTGKAMKLLTRAKEIEPENEEVLSLLSSIKEEEIGKEIEKKAEKKAEKMVKEEMSLEEALENELKKILQLDDTMGVVLVDDGGALIYADINLPLDEDTTGAIISSVYNKIETTMEDLELGNLKRVLFEMPRGNIFVIGSQSLRLIVLTGKNIHFARIEGEIRNIFKRTIDILGVD